GQVVCMADPGYYPSYSGHPFMWQAGVWTDLGYSNAYLVDINENGQISVAISGGHSYLLTPDTITGLKINNTSVTESDAANLTAVFTVTRSGPLDQASTVDFTTTDGTAKAGKDYVATSGSLTFDPGETTKTISVTVLGDLVDEYDEMFSVRLSNPTGATILG